MHDYFKRKGRALFVVAAGTVIVPLAILGATRAIAGRAAQGESPESFNANQSASSESGDPQVDPGMTMAPDSDKVSATQSASRSRAVCVKLCDGSFFPLNGAESEGREASCSRQCPAAPTQVFYLASGSDQIDDAISGSGQRYSALPVAFRYRTSVEPFCVCGAQDEKADAMLEDPTLRKGDLVMTKDGVRMFRGSATSPHSLNDFVSISQSSLPRAERDELTAMEREAARRDEAIAGGEAK